MEVRDINPRIEHQMLANTYCMNRLPGGRLCHVPIPIDQKFCPSCKKLRALDEGPEAK